MRAGVGAGAGEVDRQLTADFHTAAPTNALVLGPGAPLKRTDADQCAVVLPILSGRWAAMNANRTTAPVARRFDLE